MFDAKKHNTKGKILFFRLSAILKFFAAYY